MQSFRRFPRGVLVNEYFAVNRKLLRLLRSARGVSIMVNALEQSKTDLRVYQAKRKYGA